MAPDSDNTDRISRLQPRTSQEHWNQQASTSGNAVSAKNQGSVRQPRPIEELYLGRSRRKHSREIFLRKYKKIKNISKKKNVVIGFGITEKTIKSLKKADGLVVGSEICKKITNSIKKRQNPVKNVTNIVKRLKNKIR